MNVDGAPAVAVPTDSGFSNDPTNRKRARSAKPTQVLQGAQPGLAAAGLQIVASHPQFNSSAPGLPVSMPPPQQPSPQPGSGEMQYGLDVKRPRGRPPGSKNKIIKSGPPLIPHVMMINTGEDVVDKLREIARSYKRSVVVLAATGTLATATLMQVGAQGQGVGVTLRGQFTILSISGAILQQVTADNEALSKLKPKEPNLFLSASLANPTGGVVGGTVAGVLEASGPVTVVIGHWDATREGRPDGEMDGPTQSSQPMSLPALPATSLPGPNNQVVPHAWMGQHSQQQHSEAEDQ